MDKCNAGSDQGSNTRFKRTTRSIRGRKITGSNVGTVHPKKQSLILPGAVAARHSYGNTTLSLYFPQVNFRFVICVYAIVLVC